MDYIVKDLKVSNFVVGKVLVFDKVYVQIYIDKKYQRLELKLIKQEKTSRKKIKLNEIIEETINYINHNHEYQKLNELEYTDALKCSNVKQIDINQLKLTNKEIEQIKKHFTNLRILSLKKCTIYKQCNLGILSCDIKDNNSDIYSLDSLNGFSGKYLELRKSNIKNMNKNILHLNNEVMILSGVNINYELFFLTTTAHKLRKLSIYRYPHYKPLNDQDLLFISGFYNLEAIDIDGLITNYKEIDKLTKLRDISRLYITDKSELDKIKVLYAHIYQDGINQGFDDAKLNNFLLLNRMILQNKYIDFLHKLYVEHLTSIEWQNKIKTNDELKIKEEINSINHLNSFEKNKIGREERDYTMFDSINDLDFDRTCDLEEEYLMNSRPFESNGINYYVKRKRLTLDKYGSTYGKYNKR